MESALEGFRLMNRDEQFGKGPEGREASGERYDKQGVVISVDAWERLISDPQYRQIGSTEIGTILIQTTWRGFDPDFASFSAKANGTRPLIFETKVSAPDNEELNGETWRYESLEQAIAGHEVVVSLVRNFGNKTEESLPTGK
jgi:hypothetical protein